MNDQFGTRYSISKRGRKTIQVMLQGLGLILVSLLFPSGLVLADFSGNPEDGHGHMMGWGDGGAMMLFGPVMMIGIVVVIVLIVVSLMQRKTHSNDGYGDAATSALALLNERYAKGDIDHEEYEERKRRIKDS